MPGASGEDVTGLWNPTERFMQLVEPMLRGLWENGTPHEKA
jgi:hypothetical protein